MNPTSPQINQDQQNRLNSVMNTPTSPQNPQQPISAPPQQNQTPPAPGTVGSIAPAQNIGGIAQPQPLQQSTYQVPTVGMPSPGLGTNTQPMAPSTNTKKAKSKHASGGFSIMPVIYVLGGLVFLLVYTVVWVVVFDVSIPFLPF